MKCEECRPLLDLYFDRELEQREAAAVAAHLGGCASCSAEYQRLLDEQELYLRHECGPVDASAFWEGLLAKVRAEKVTRPATLLVRLRRRRRPLLPSLSAPRFSLTLTAAMLLAAVGLTAVVTTYLGPREDAPDPAIATRVEDDRVEQSPTVTDDGMSGGAPSAARNQRAQGPVPGDTNRATRERSGKPQTGKAQSAYAFAAKGARRSPNPAPRENAPDKLVREAEQRYLAAIAILSRDARRRRTRMEPDTLARFDSALAAIDRAIVETRAAAREHPRDPVAVQYMLAAYAKKVELLKGLAQD